MMPPEMGRAPSQGSVASQTTQIVQPHSRPGTADPMRARSENVISRNGRRPRSRGSTASIHSQQTQDQNGPDGFSQFLPTQHGAGHHNVFANNPEDIIMRFGPNLSHSVNDAGLDSTLPDAHHSVMPRAEDFSQHALQAHGLSHQALPPELGGHGLPNVSMSQYQSMYDSGIENQVPDHLLDENDNSETGGTKKKKGSSSSLANDNELRKLLRQYEGYSLKQMAAEVLKHEGAGGKAEKVKQVFAMIWLRENCRKSSGSVRRDRVYCCYAEKCGTERVSVLNPASFGKLVRIIFPNVQTRRLGVRGESKYHYVDLTVIEEKQQKPASMTPQLPSRLSLPATQPENRTDEVLPKSNPIAQAPVDTAVFPSPTTSFPPRMPPNLSNAPCACQSRTGLDPPMTTENVASHAGKMIHQMLQFPSADGCCVDNDSLQLPDIHPYLPPNADLKVAAALAALYRSHCISVIDSFRYCKERNLLRYFSAFHGTLTVPVQKLLTHPDLAPWIKECDWLMYQKMIAFVAPLTTQVVPKLVLDAFSSISQRLTSHIAETFKSQPTHVSLARLIPANVFCSLLRHMLDVNQSANAAAAWLCHPDNRNQMWFDFKTLIDPKDMTSKANVPRCAERTVEQILKYDVRALLTPVSDSNVAPCQRFFETPDTEDDVQAHRIPVQSSTGDDYNFPDKWVSFILNLPLVFPSHRTQCVIERVDALWDCILHRLTLGGAQSFSAWWMTKVFFHEMMVWQAEQGGFMRSKPSSLQNALFGAEQPEMTNLAIRQPSYSTSEGNQPLMPADTQEAHQPGSQATASPAVGSDVPQDRQQSLDKSRIGAESNPNNMNNRRSTGVAENIASFHATNNDDSAIDLEDDSMLMAVGKYGDMMASDPADAEGDVVVI